MTPTGGQNTRIQFGGSYNARCKEWKRQGTLVGEAEITNSESPQDANFVAYAERTPVVRDCVLTLTIIFDMDNLPSASPPNLVTGATLSTVRLYVSKTSSKFHLFTSMIVCEDGEQMTIKDIVWWSGTLKTTGSWTIAA